MIFSALEAARAIVAACNHGEAAGRSTACASCIAAAGLRLARPRKGAAPSRGARVAALGLLRAQRALGMWKQFCRGHQTLLAGLRRRLGD